MQKEEKNKLRQIGKKMANFFNLADIIFNNRQLTVRFIMKD